MPEALLQAGTVNRETPDVQAHCAARGSGPTGRRPALLVRLPRRAALLVEAFGAVVLARLGLSFLRYSRIRAKVDAVAPRKTVINEDGTPGRCSKAVSFASRVVPKASCLTQALALRWMLNRRGIASTLRFGVARPDGQKLAAHAWLECDGRIIIGGRQSAEKYASF
jgi:hypothetical protein